jgi:hypothetical protein
MTTGVFPRESKRSRGLNAAQRADGAKPLHIIKASFLERTVRKSFARNRMRSTHTEPRTNLSRNRKRNAPFFRSAHLSTAARASRAVDDRRESAGGELVGFARR